MDISSAAKTLAELLDPFRTLGVLIGTGQNRLHVYWPKGRSLHQNGILDTWEGYPVSVSKVGKTKALSA